MESYNTHNVRLINMRRLFDLGNFLFFSSFLSLFIFRRE